MRWAEEVELLQEEMRRVLQFFDTQAKWWEVQAVPWDSDDVGTSQGRCAYAAQQANLRRRLHSHFAHLWRHVKAYITRGGWGVLDEEDVELSDDDSDVDDTVA